MNMQRVKSAASGLALSAVLALSAGTGQAQDKQIVPFLTAESSPESVQKILGLIAEFEAANPDIGIELQLMSNDNRGPRIINSVSVGDELGVFEIERRIVPDLTKAGYLLPLDSIVEEIGIENFIPGSLLYWPWDGHLYQFTSDLSGATLYWRKDAFEEAGLAEPDSYERILEALQKLHGQNNMWGASFDSSNRGAVQRFVTFLWQNCGDFYTQDGELAFDRPGALQAVEDYAELNKYAPPGSHSWGGLDGLKAFVSGRLAIHLFPGRLGYDLFTNAPDIAKVTGNREGRVARGGKGPRVVYGAVTSYSIGSTVKHPEAAKKFLKFLFTGQPLLNYAMTVPGHIAPALKNVQAEILEQDNPYIKQHRDWVELILEATTYFNAEAQNMGSITDECEFKKSLVPMPWSSRVMGQAPVVSTMFQKIALENVPVDDAYAEAVDLHRTLAEEWKKENGWEPPPKDWAPPGMQ
jgi:ABC-type glycerol-3-phosphate transport system substrate-binding protein